MTAAALGSKVRFTSLGVTNQRVRRWRFALRRRSLTTGRRHDAVDVLSDGLHVVVGHLRQGRHAALGASSTNDWKNELAVLIHEHDRGPKQVGAAGDANAKIDAVTAAAIR